MNVYSDVSVTWDHNSNLEPSVIYFYNGHLLKKTFIGVFFFTKIVEIFFLAIRSLSIVQHYGNVYA